MSRFDCWPTAPPRGQMRYDTRWPQIVKAGYVHARFVPLRRATASLTCVFMRRRVNTNLSNYELGHLKTPSPPLPTAIVLLSDIEYSYKGVFSFFPLKSETLPAHRQDQITVFHGDHVNPASFM